MRPATKKLLSPSPYVHFFPIVFFFFAYGSHTFVLLSAHKTYRKRPGSGTLLTRNTCANIVGLCKLYNNVLRSRRLPSHRTKQNSVLEAPNAPKTLTIPCNRGQISPKTLFKYKDVVSMENRHKRTFSPEEDTGLTTHRYAIVFLVNPEVCPGSKTQVY